MRKLNLLLTFVSSIRIFLIGFLLDHSYFVPWVLLPFGGIHRDQHNVLNNEIPKTWTIIVLSLGPSCALEKARCWFLVYWLLLLKLFERIFSQKWVRVCIYNLTQSSAIAFVISPMTYDYSYGLYLKILMFLTFRR